MRIDSPTLRENTLINGSLSSNSSGIFETLSANSATFFTISAASYLGITAGGDDAEVSTKVRASSAYWDSTYTTVAASSAAWGGGSITITNMVLLGL